MLSIAQSSSRTRLPWSTDSSVSSMLPRGRWDDLAWRLIRRSVGFVYDEASLSSTEYIVKVQVTVGPAGHSRRLFVAGGSDLFCNIKLVVSLGSEYCRLRMLAPLSTE
jgi:hypothetical protein